MHSHSLFRILRFRDSEDETGTCVSEGREKGLPCRQALAKVRLWGNQKCFKVGNGQLDESQVSFTSGPDPFDSASSSPGSNGFVESTLVIQSLALPVSQRMKRYR
jgi:hypothetical protein